MNARRQAVPSRVLCCHLLDAPELTIPYKNVRCAKSTKWSRSSLSINRKWTDGGGGSVPVERVPGKIQGFQFEEAAYTIGETCGKLEVTVIRTGSGKITASDGIGNNAAIYPDDYTTQEAFITFLENQQSQVVTFNINADGNNEGAETFTLTLSKVSGFGDVSQAVATVTIQDQNVIYSVEDPDITRIESSGSQPVYFIRTGDFCRASEIFVSTRRGTALPGEDYIGFTSRLVSFGTNSNRASLDLVVIDDRNEERTERFTVEIQGSDIQIGSGVTTVTVQDNDGKVRFSKSEYSAVEGSGSADLTIEVDSDITPTRVEVETIIGSGTAIAGTDYTIVSSRFIDFSTSETSKTFSVPILDDGDDENDETFRVAIVSTTSGSKGDPDEAIVTILDDDKISGSGLSIGAIIGIAGGVGGGVLLLIVIGICLAVSSLRPGPRPVAVAARGRAGGLAPYNINRAVNYAPDDGYQGYGQPRRQPVYYR
ncbi:FRAS1-related extracellular matrix protein 2-like [Amphiura filiformis]|uniref:FRAS1-related extracellular matrix protein 2-like n=1 Tax=Amphiura filiformis TaxID=82378 RepID=UPI003B2270C5